MNEKSEDELEATKHLDEVMNNPNIREELRKDFLEEVIHGKHEKWSDDNLAGRQAPLDRHGDCPNCKASWDGGDIYETLSMMDIHIAKPPSDVLKLAEQFGWTKENKKRFSNIISHEIESSTYTTTNDINSKASKKITVSTTFYQCPKCLHAFIPLTGKHFDSLNEARNSLYE